MWFELLLLDRSVGLLEWGVDQSWGTSVASSFSCSSGAGEER